MTRRIQRKWVPYQEGDTIGGALILKRTHLSSAQMQTWYRVRWLCCDKEGSVNHRRLLYRERDLSTLCNRCSRVANAQLVGQMNRIQQLEAQKQQPHCPEAITIPPPGIDGIWMPLGTLGPRWKGRGTDHVKGGRTE